MVFAISAAVQLIATHFGGMEAAALQNSSASMRVDMRVLKVSSSFANSFKANHDLKQKDLVFLLNTEQLKRLVANAAADKFGSLQELLEREIKLGINTELQIVKTLEFATSARQIQHGDQTGWEPMRRPYQVGVNAHLKAELAPDTKYLRIEFTTQGTWLESTDIPTSIIEIDQAKIPIQQPRFATVSFRANAKAVNNSDTVLVFLTHTDWVLFTIYDKKDSSPKK